MLPRVDRSRLRLEIPSINQKLPSPTEKISTIAGSIESFEVVITEVYDFFFFKYNYYICWILNIDKSVSQITTVPTFDATECTDIDLNSELDEAELRKNLLNDVKKNI